MKNLTTIGVLCVLGLFMVSASHGAPKAEPKPTKASVAMIHVIKGCAACEAMQVWLSGGGVELEITSVQQGAYSVYPTVVYSDKFIDNGDRMYKQQVVIPQKICIVSCSSGTN